MHSVAVRAVAFAGVQRGERVLDVATGTGNAAVEAAGIGAVALGVDFEPALLRIAKARAAESGLQVNWELADAGALGVSDGWANVVVSIFGVMYAADHDRAARELSRCVATDGRIVLASWTPGSFMPELGQVLATFLPPPATGTGPPSRWGDLGVLDELFAPNGMRIRTHAEASLTLTFESATDATQFLIRTAGNVIAERERLTQQGRWKDVHAAVHGLVESRGRREHDDFGIDLQYLLAVMEHG
ncbi:MAG TPA: class I SAM-dependent methyltransferase [Acidimicrobiia bacterium]|nr:class I SAM-dependent methyltransferase [Acidimicrobiia bacterium]